MNYKISFCTVCMNRLHHLRETLPKNIETNRSHTNAEFIVMDYNSSDGLSTWIKDEMSDYIDKGLLTYYRYDKAKHFDRSHSRNMMFKLATGDIICNVDADNYLGTDFYRYVNSIFNAEDNIFLVPDTKRKYYYIRDALGRFCAKKTDFLAVRGYDEKMNGYGFEDDDLYDRLTNIGKREVVIRDLRYLKAIKHTNKDRVENEFFTRCLDSIYIHYESIKRSHIFLLYKDCSFNKGAIILNEGNSASPARIENLAWMRGSWNRNDGNIIVKFFHAEENILSEHENSFVYENNIFHKIKDPAFLERIPYDLPLITNYSRFLYNRENRNFVNNEGFGEGSVHKNFTPVDMELNVKA